MDERVNRTRYVKGVNAGMVRHRKVRARRRLLLSAGYESPTNGVSSMMVFCTVGGYRDCRSGPTVYPLESEQQMVFVLRELDDDRFYRDPYPSEWKGLNDHELKSKVARQLDDFGKEFLEFGGIWWEVERTHALNPESVLEPREEWLVVNQEEFAACEKNIDRPLPYFGKERFWHEGRYFEPERETMQMMVSNFRLGREYAEG